MILVQALQSHAIDSKRELAEKWYSLKCQFTSTPTVTTLTLRWLSCSLLLANSRRVEPTFLMSALSLWTERTHHKALSQMMSTLKEDCAGWLAGWELFWAWQCKLLLPCCLPCEPLESVNTMRIVHLLNRDRPMRRSIVHSNETFDFIFDSIISVQTEERKTKIVDTLQHRQIWFCKVSTLAKESPEVARSDKVVFPNELATRHWWRWRLTIGKRFI